jgi:hypothetical protein
MPAPALRPVLAAIDAATAKARAELTRFIDAAAKWELTPAQLKVLLGDLSPATPAGDHPTVAGSDLIERVVLICRIRRGLALVLGDDSLVLRWMHDPQLAGTDDGIAPLDRMMASPIEALYGVWHFIERWERAVGMPAGPAQASA